MKNLLKQFVAWFKQLLEEIFSKDVFVPVVIIIVIVAILDLIALPLWDLGAGFILALLYAIAKIIYNAVKK